MGSVNFSGDCTFIELYKSACIHKLSVRYLKLIFWLSKMDFSMFEIYDC